MYFFGTRGCGEEKFYAQGIFCGPGKRKSGKEALFLLFRRLSVLPDPALRGLPGPVSDTALTIRNFRRKK